MIRLLGGLIILFLMILPSQAHEVRPAFLSINQTGETSFSVSWKQPVLSGRRLKLDPSYPEGCEFTPGTTNFSGNSLTETSTLSCALDTGSISIAGLERTLTDTFVEINYLSGETKRALLKPGDPTLNLAEASANGVRDYLPLGVEHIVFGFDHILFVIGLALLVRARQIWLVATSFTLAHSLTLALAAFGWLVVPSRPVEILIAMSIVFLGVEVVRKLRGEETLAARRPYLISFVIGLLHGCGFAGALADIGLPKGAELTALLLFNVGIELGQFAIIAAFILLMAAICKIDIRFERRFRWVTTYAIAAVAMFWVIDRTKDYWVL